MHYLADAQSLHLGNVDYVILAIYFAFVLGVGVLLKRFVRTGATTSSLPGGPCRRGSRGWRSSRPTWARRN